MNSKTDITIIMPTYNRAAVLRETLAALAGVDRGALRVELVVIDNNSNDQTADVLCEFARRLPLRALFEPQPGKNKALNRALTEVELGEIVLFTDDDVTPAADWLHAVWDAAQRWPQYQVFGGRIEVCWPPGAVPGWAEVPFIKAFGFAHHDYAPDERPYGPGHFPFGPNYWVRRTVFDDGRRFCENIGPHPTNRILGDETLFLKQLREDGHEQLYCPRAVVQHRIQPEALSAAAIKRRAATLGRGGPLVGGLCRRQLLDQHPLLWRSLRHAALWYYRLRYLLAQLTPDPDQRVVRSVQAIINIAYNAASLELAARRAPAAAATGSQPAAAL